MENYKELLTALYEEHAPEKIKQIDYYLERYKGKEKQFYITQKAKYSNKKKVTDHKKILEEAMARIQRDKETKLGQKAAKTEEQKPKEETKKEEAQEIIKPAISHQEKKTEEVKTEKPIEQKLEKQEKLEDQKELIEEKAENKKAPVVLNPPLKKVEEKKKEEAPKISNPPPVQKEEEPIATKEKPAVESPVKTSTEIKEEHEKLKQENLKAEREKLQKNKAGSQKKEKRNSMIIWYFGGAAVIILAVALAVWFFHFRTAESPREEAINIQKVTVETEPVQSKEVSEKEAQANKKEEVKETKSEVEKTVKETPKKAVVQKKSPQTRPTADRIYARDINKPAYFVACFAAKTEAMAQKKISLLKEYKLDAHYYWIPDLDASGNEYFKVVAGPFSSWKEAAPSLTTAQERVNFDSYILVIK